MRKTLILGGTTEASRLAGAMADAGLPAVLSYAGRTRSPRAQPVPVRMGGFGGIEGLARYLREAGIARVIDATHPFAAEISRNAVAACTMTGTPLLAFERPPWRAGAGDDWREVPDLAAAAAALPPQPTRVFLAIGRQHLDAFRGRAQHHYLLRLVDPPEGALPLPDCAVEVARGPFDEAADRALLMRHRINLVVAKNAGGEGARAKLAAARALGLPVIMVARPALPARRIAGTLEDVLGWLHADLGV
ncbi:cobalt-precorrin-6A reductase [Pontibaca methylaminivorans]|uniref:cobalt-precorrin-6A reductase n=1 Tax=Pontibaca methylaminivorans TaxID=515897 RepID=UPI002FDA1533